MSNRPHTPPRAGPGAYDSTVLPPSHSARTLVLCFDGTGDQFDAYNSNILQFFSMLKKDDKSQQMVYYQAGIGIYTTPAIATPLWSKVHKYIDLALGSHPDAHVIGGYEFLMENYRAEDKICIFGFSRGAYTAQALAGMIHKVGLLPAGNHQQVPFAYKMFSRDDDVGWHQSTVFKKVFTTDVEIEFVGVWDTVCPVGLVPHSLPFTTSNTAVRNFRHARSLDERRAIFKANDWYLMNEADRRGIRLGEMPRSNRRHPRHYDQQHDEGKSQAEDAHDDGRPKTDVQEVWFAGCHCDIGGGSVPNGTRNSLARIPLRWMIRQCFLTNTGIQFHREKFGAIGFDPATLYPFVLPRPPALTADASVLATRKHAADYKTEEDEELKDALCPLYDQLTLSWAWWILEIIPLRHCERSRRNASWVPYWMVNWGRACQIPKPDGKNKKKIHVHRSVRIRMEAEDLKGGNYVPKAKFDHVDCEWVD